MDTIREQFTVYFEEPFWIGVFEKYESDRLSVAKYTFGAEPKDYEVHEFLLKHYYELRFSPAVACVVKETRANPKKLQRDIRRQIENRGIGTRSQQALKLLQEQNKIERKAKSRQAKEAEAERIFALKQEKRREKHRGH